MKKTAVVFLVSLSIVLIFGVYTHFSEKGVDHAADVKLIDYEDVLARSKEIIEVSVEGNGYGYLSKAIKEGKKIYLGTEIPVYILGQESIRLSESLKYYPVFLEDEIVGNIIARNTENQKMSLEFLDIFKEQMNSYLTEGKPVCMFIDKNSIWLSNEDRCNKIFYDDHVTKSLGTFSPEMRKNFEAEYSIMEKQDEIGLK